jgi:hypothetical protein
MSAVGALHTAIQLGGMGCQDKQVNTHLTASFFKTPPLNSLRLSEKTV